MEEEKKRKEEEEQKLIKNSTLKRLKENLIKKPEAAEVKSSLEVESVLENKEVEVKPAVG